MTAKHQITYYRWFIVCVMLSIVVSLYLGIVANEPIITGLHVVVCLYLVRLTISKLQRLKEEQQ